MRGVDRPDPNYVDDGALREQDRVPLEDFLAFDDRAQFTGRGQPFFSGRDKEISAFRQVANALLLGHRGNATLVVEGAPGAGKSALLAQFQEEMRSFPPAGPNRRRWLPVMIDGALAMSPLEIMAAVDRAIAHRLAQDLVDARNDAEQADSAHRLATLLGQTSLDNAKSTAKGILNRGVSAMGFSIGAKGDPPPVTLLQAADRRARAWADWQTVLLVDEAQRVSDRAPQADPGALSAIHQGLINAPLSFCCFGLPGTSAALADVGVSRLSAGHDLPLAGLGGGAARMAVERCFARYGATHAESWQEAILERSSNWPQHIAAYLNAALTVLNANAASPEAMGDARRSSLSEAIALGDEGRSHYYEMRIQRLNSDNERHERYAKALVPLFRQHGGLLPKDEAIDFLEGEPLRLSEATVDRFLAAAARSGFLEKTPRGGLRMPIPSFAGHLLNEPVPSLPDLDASRRTKVRGPLP